MKHLTNQTKNEGQVIALESEAFRQLLDEAVSYIRKQHGLSGESRWVGSDEAKHLLGISSNTTLQQLRNQGKIRFSQPMHKVVLYDRASLEDYIESHARNTF